MRRLAEWSATTLAISAVLLLASVPLLAQTHFASVSGTVTAQDGHPLASVAVLATNVATQVAYMARSNEVGLYTIAALPIGIYTIRATTDKFHVWETNPITLESGRNARVNISMQVGVEESIVVSDVAPILQTADAVVGQTISATTIEALPLNGRNFSQLSLLLPGVVTTSPDSFSEPKNFFFLPGRPFVNGQRDQANNFMLDGADMNEAIDNSLPYQPSPDALAEVRVETNNSSAEFGNVAGAIINSTIKSGTNELHGNVFEYWRDNSLAANSWDNNRVGGKRSELSQHIFGATVGGPIKKNRVFFFADYQGFVRNVPGQAPASVAPAEWRRGDFSGLDVVIFDPVTGQPFPGNIVPEERFSPVARKVLGDTYLYPLPTLPGATNNLIVDTSDKKRAHQGDLKIDATVSDKDRLFARFSIQKYKAEPERGALPSDTVHTTDSPFKSVALDWTRTLGVHSLNELLLGFAHVKAADHSTDWAGIGNANATVGIPGGQAIPGLSALAFGNLGLGSGGGEQLNDIKTFQVTDKLSVFKGRHNMKLGGRWLYQRQGGFESGDAGLLGYFYYSGAFTGFPFADFLLDAVTLKGRGTTAPPWTQLQHRIGLFAQDDFRFTSNLTLNLGVAWEFTSPLVEKDDRQSNIDLTTGRLLLAGQDGNSRALYDAYYGGFEPRVGFAWTPSEKWVVRGAYGMVQYMEGMGKNLRLTLNPPFFAEGVRFYDASTGPGSAADGFTDLSPNVTGSGYLFRAFAKDLRPQLTQQWNVFVERKLTESLSGELGYVGHHATHMVVPRDFNQPEPDPGPVETWRSIDERRPLHALNPSIGTMSGTDSIGISNYNALQVSLRQRSKKGLEFLASYTYAKALSDSVGYYGIGSSQGSIQGFYYLDNSDPRRDYGRSPYDVRHSVSLAGTYELPWGRNRQFGSEWKGLRNAVLGNWNVHTIFQTRSGLPVTVIDFGGQSLQATRSFERPDRLCRGAVPHPGVDDPWIDINCFSRAPAGQFGDSGVGILTGPGYWNLDLGIGKNLYVDDKRYLTLKVEAFNVLNHANFALNVLSTNSADPGTFGRIQNTFSGPRLLELVVKFSY